MTILNTPNLNVPYPDGEDDVSDAPPLLQEMVAVLDSLNGPVATRLIEGVLATMPSAASTPIGTIFRAIDTGMMVILNSTRNWELLPAGQSLPPIGSMQHYAGPSDPIDPDGVTRWLICDGRAISRSAHLGCFGVIGVKYGSGDGTSTFNIPNGLSRVLMTTANPSSVAQIGGAETVNAELPAHTHVDTGHVHSISGNTHIHSGNGNEFQFYTGVFGGEQVPFVGSTPAPSSAVFAGPTRTASTKANLFCANSQANLQTSGAGGGHSNVQPYLALNHIIRVL